MNIKVMAGLVAGAVLAAFLTAWQIQDWRYGEKIENLAHAHTQAVLQAETKARQTEKALAAKVAEVDRLSNQAREEVKIITETVEKEVVRYVEKDPAAGSCQLSAGWVRTHNRATLRVSTHTTSTGPPDEPAGRARDAGSG